MKNNNLKIATRQSALALWQSNHIKNLLEEKYKIEVELLPRKTKGDILLTSPLAKIGGKGLFTKELEELLLEKQAQIAVHSLKDFSFELPQGLCLAAYSKRADVRDAFLSFKYPSLEALPKNARVGTTSLRRRMQLKLLREDLEIISLRGNINTRIAKLEAGNFDAIILAKAGLDRLDLCKTIPFLKVFELEEMLPAMSQGILGIEAIKDEELLEALSFLNDENSFIEASIERAFVQNLNGGCQVPIGINAKIQGEEILIKAILGLPDGSKILKANKTIKKEAYREAGKNLAQEFLAQGAEELLAQAYKMAENLN